MFRYLMCLGLAAACIPAACIPVAQAQTPSFDSIFNGLSDKPFANTHRGIRPAGAAAPSAAAAPAAPAPATSASASAGYPAAATPPRTAVAAARPVVAAARPTAESSAPAAAEPRSVNLTIEFVSGSDQLTPAATGTLDMLGRVLTDASMQNNRFRLEGHTDTAGNPETNRILSERRARTVESYLVAKFHIDPSRLEALGRGQEDLLVPTPPQTPEPRNRRVRVINLGA